MEIIWKAIAKVAAIPAVANWIIHYAQKTPYWHLEGYMDRWWIFNPCDDGPNGEEVKKWPRLPSIRVHHIKRADVERDDHNHPWPCRTIILKGWYKEIRRKERPFCCMSEPERWIRPAGSTVTIEPYDFHKITEVHPEGVYTLFITWLKIQHWGFMTKNGFVRANRYFVQMRRQAEKKKSGYHDAA